MPKRKRSSESSVQDKLEKCRNEVSRALKLAKSFERQRMNKRLHDDGITAEKKGRLEREIAVLKSLDLHQTARAHLYSSLVKVKTIAASTDLPDDVRNGVPKPELTEEEKIALHNVTSGLYNREHVKKAIDNSVVVVCEALGVPKPEKGKRIRKSKRDDDDEQPSDSAKPTVKEAKAEPIEKRQDVEEEDSEVSEFEGFGSDDDDEPGPAVAEPDSEAEVAEESAFSKYDHLLGSSDDDSEEEPDEELFERLKGREKVNLDDISGSGSEASLDSDSESDSEANSDSSSNTPAPKKKKTKKQAVAPIRDSTFLPSLMGGYVSGSESASDVDVAPAKKRRGQKARQAIWEKKYGHKAKHLHAEAQGGRDAGWDMKRGAVDGADQGRQTPWRRGADNPLGNRGRDGPAAESKPVVKREKDDQGPLHPSWVAKKKAKESQKPVAFSGQKVVFD